MRLRPSCLREAAAGAAAGSLAALLKLLRLTVLTVALTSKVLSTSCIEESSKLLQLPTACVTLLMLSTRASLSSRF